MQYLEFYYKLTLRPAKGCLWKFFRVDYNEETIHIIKWIVEYDTLNDCVNRELGFNSEGIVNYYAPSKMFYGYWGDADMQFNDFEKFNPEYISAEHFNNNWKKEYDLIK